MNVEGYASLFGVPDLVGDVVRRGAFRRELGKPTPMLVRHDPKLVAGVWTELTEDVRGLFVRGVVDPAAPAGALARRLIAEGVDGLSIGFVTRAALALPGGRELVAVALLEISLVPLPMQPRARLSRNLRALKETA
jgi:uncharacterized protein